jgi:hypothetical protein
MRATRTRPIVGSRLARRAAPPRARRRKSARLEVEYLERRTLLNGAIWYVDVNAAGSATQDGSAAHPFSKIQQGINAADASGGDTVKVLAGQYNENVNVDRTVALLGT